jgi:RNAse (barnase) inhibitor barstar
MDLKKIFSSISPPYLHLVICDTREFANWSVPWLDLEKRDIVARIIRGKKCSTAKDLFNEFSAALQFPYYFGENWDALDECITDLEWIPGNGYLFFISDADKILPNSDRDFHILIDLLQKAGKEWAESHETDQNFPRSPKCFHVVFHCQPAFEHKMIEKLVNVKAEFSKISINKN